MTFIKYQHFNLRRSSYALIDRINMVIDDFQAEGYTATLRQIYYQLVQSNVIPNTVQSYDNLGVLIKKGRLMGLISWDAIEDRNRGISPWLIQPSQLSVLDGLEQQLAYDLWTPQGVYLEVWVEKDAQSNVVERPCAEYRVPFMPCRGYMSTSVVMAAQAFPDTVMIGDEAVPVDELVVLEGTRNQRRLQRKRLMKGKTK